MSAERNHKSSSPKSKAITLPYFVPATLRAVAVDGAVVTAKVDPIGASLQINFTRMDYVPLSETFEAQPIEGGSGMLQSGAPSYEMPARKVVEAIVSVRPDHAFQLASAIMINLNNLSSDLKGKYQIPAMNLIEALKVASESEV